MHAFQRICILLLLLLPAWGCSGVGAPSPPDPVKVESGGGRFLSYEPPAGWEQDGAQWYKSGEGRLTVQAAGPDVRKQASDRLVEVLAVFGEGPQAVEKALGWFPPAPLNDEPDREHLEALARKVRDARFMVRKDPARARREFEDALRGFREAELGDDPQVRGRAWLENLNLRGGSHSLESMTATTCADRPAAVAITSTHEPAVWTTLFLVDQGELMVFRIRTNVKERALGIERIQELAEGIRLDVSAPVVAVAEPSPTPAPAAKSHRRGASPWVSLAKKILPPLVFLLFTSVPAWLGAAFGYENAALMGRSPRAGAAGGAFWGTFWGVLGAALVVSVLVFTLLWGSGGAGIMTPELASVVLVGVLLVLASVAGTVGGALAAVGAWLGAATSRRTASLMAAVLAAAGVILGFSLFRG